MLGLASHTQLLNPPKKRTSLDVRRVQEKNSERKGRRVEKGGLRK